MLIFLPNDGKDNGLDRKLLPLSMKILLILLEYCIILTAFKVAPAAKSVNLQCYSVGIPVEEPRRKDIQISWRNPVDKSPVSIVMEMQIQRNPLAYDDDEGKGATVQCD